MKHFKLKIQTLILVVALFVAVPAFGSGTGIISGGNTGVGGGGSGFTNSAELRAYLSDPVGSETIDGVDTAVILTNYGSVSVYSDGTNLFIY
jgi:hypothetical protein